MTLTTLLLIIGSISTVITLIVVFLLKAHKNILVSFLQNFCGVLFIFSGWVKAIDPLGTAYKMEQYFDEFKTTFEGTWFSFLAPMFPVLSDQSIVFSVVMIVFEIVLGIMLVIGLKRKWTSWAFLILVAFFTFLTGFTYLTGYVPEGKNFFQFSEWAAYNANNMKVTDCGCFGDFIKLVPKTSFFKDVILLFPAILFVFSFNKMHELFNNKIKWGITILSTIGLLVYCFSNYSWDIPGTDFRPFKIGADVMAQRELEIDAMSNVQIVAWKLKNREDGKIVELPNDVYMSQFKNYPKEEWEIIEQVKTEPTIKATKISEMEFTHLEDQYDITDELLEEDKASLMIVSHKLYMKVNQATRMVKDTSYLIDTVLIMNDGTETQEIVKTVNEISEKEQRYYEYSWDKEFIEEYKNKIAPMVNKAKADGITTRIAIGGADPDAIAALSREAGLENAVFLTADDILLKTIVRSNPGTLVWKKGKILHKWHINKLPSYDEIKNNFMK